MDKLRLCACGFALAAVVWPRPALAAKVACVGDSITYGYGLANPSQQSYPTLLQTQLGSKHTVKNFGTSGCTLLKKGDKPYWNDANFGASDAFKPDVVVVMLGTNDAKPQNWSRKAEFAGDYASLIEHYRSLGALVYVAAPPPVYPPGAFDIPSDVVANEVVPLVRQVATDAGAPLIDVFKALSGKAGNFPDKVHPDAAGAQIIADTVAAALQSGGFGGAGGTATGGASGTGGAATGGATGSGGASGVGGKGGATGTGGSAGGADAATDTGGGSLGGSPGAGGSSQSTGGATGTTSVGGATGSGGSTPGAGGTTTSNGGTVSDGGRSGSGGVSGTGGSATSGGSSGGHTTTPGSGGTDANGGGSASGCGCDVFAAPRGGEVSLLLMLTLLALARWARMRGRESVSESRHANGVGDSRERERSA